MLLACEQALLFGRVKRVSRECASERQSREGQRSREARFACPNRRACSQASMLLKRATGRGKRKEAKRNVCRNSLLVLKSTPRGHGLVDFRPFPLKIRPRFWRSNVSTVHSRLNSVNFSIVIVVACKPSTWTYEMFNRSQVHSVPCKPRGLHNSSYHTKAELDYRLIIHSKYFQAQNERHTSLLFLYILAIFLVSSSVISSGI